jgi:hypothetical protein
MNVAILIINVYIVFNLLFFIIKYFKVDRHNLNNSPDMTWLVYYFILSFFILFSQNYYYSLNSEKNCRIDNLLLFIFTIMPLALVMGPIIILLMKMNMNRIFANTFGNLLTPKLVFQSAKNDAIYFYNDPNTLLQEIDVDILFDLERLQSHLEKLLNIPSFRIDESLHNSIKQQYYIKQNIGYFIWLVFTGIIASLISINSVLLQDCIIE